MDSNSRNKKNNQNIETKKSNTPSRQFRGQMRRLDREQTEQIESKKGESKARSEAKKYLREKERPVLENKIRAEMARKLETLVQQERSRIKNEMKSELELRIKTLTKERERLEPSQLLGRFAAQATRMLSKLDIPETDALNQEIGKTLRKTILDVMSSRRQHLSQLTKLERFIREGELDQLPLVLEEFFFEVGIKKIDDPAKYPNFFTSLNSPEEGSALEVIEPALIDDVTGKILRSGTVKHVEEG